MENDLATATLNGLTQLQQLGLAGIFLSFIFILFGFALWYFVRKCDQRTEASQQAYREESSNNRAVIEKNTEAINNFHITLAVLKDRSERGQL